MAENGARTSRQHRSHPSPARVEDPMPDGVDTTMDRMQAARGQPVANRTPPDPELE
jgi:hypothetical protein